MDELHNNNKPKTRRHFDKEFKRQESVFEMEKSNSFHRSLEAAVAMSSVVENLEEENSVDEVSTDQRSCRVWLAVVGSRTTPDDISEQLGLVPTRTTQEGTPTPPLANGQALGRIAKTNRWETRIPVSSEHGLDEHLACLEAILTDDVVDRLRALSTEATIRIEIEVTRDSGIVISRRLVRLIADAGGEFDIAVREGVGVSDAAMADAVANPLDVVAQSGGRYMFVGQNAVVVLNSNGEVITTWATNSAGWRVVP